MNNQTTEQRRELRRFFDRKGTETHCERPWYVKSDAKQAAASVLLYLALALAVVVCVPIAVNLVLNWVGTVKVFL